MKRWNLQLAGVAKALSVAAVLGFASQVGAADITWDRLQNADKDANNWLMYHGSYKGWHYSALDQINKSNVKNLKVAWIHTPSTGKRGIQSFPLVADGVLYYTSTTGQIWALDAGTGAFMWGYKAKIDEERARLAAWLEDTKGRWPYLGAPARAALKVTYLRKLDDLQRLITNFNLTAPPGVDHIGGLRLADELSKLGS